MLWKLPSERDGRAVYTQGMPPVLRCCLLSAALWLNPGQSQARELSAPLVADSLEPDYLIVGGGVSGVLRGERMGNAALAYRWHDSWHGLSPGLVAGFATHARYLAVTLGHSFKFGKRRRLTLSTGPGLYERGKRAPNLGSPLEFVSTLEFSWPVRGQRRVAVAMAHISNANLAALNPGSELLEILYQLPISR